MSEDKKNGGRHEQSPSEPKRLPDKKEKHLVSDEKIMQKYGVHNDIESENDTAESDRNAAPPKPADAAARKKRRNTYIIIAVVAACAIALILWLAIPNSGNSHYDNNMSGIVEDVLETKEGFPATINGTNVTSGNFYSMDRELVYVSDTSVVRLNQKAKAVFERSHSFYHPITKVSGEYMMVYNVGSNGFRIDNTKDTVRNEEAENIIMAADVSENGRYALVTETKGYPSALSVYKEDGSLQYKYSFSNCYVSDISLNADGTRAVVIGVTASEGELVSEVYLLDFNNETPLAIVECKDTLLLSVEFCSDGRALAVGDDRVVSVNDSGEKTDYEYGSMKLAAFDYDGSRLLVALSPYDTESASKLAVISSKGEEIAVRDCEDIMTDVSLYGDTMAALSGQKVYNYSVNAVRNFHGNDGEQQAAFHVTEAANDTKAIALADESSIYLLGISEVRFEDY